MRVKNSLIHNIIIKAVEAYPLPLLFVLRGKKVWFYGFSVGVGFPLAPPKRSDVKRFFLAVSVFSVSFFVRSCPCGL